MNEEERKLFIAELVKAIKQAVREGVVDALQRHDDAKAIEREYTYLRKN
jgi:hypothetical protein